MEWENKTVRYKDLDVTITYTRRQERGERCIYLAHVELGSKQRFVLSHPSAEGLVALIQRVLPVAYFARFHELLPVTTIYSYYPWEA